MKKFLMAAAVASIFGAPAAANAANAIIFDRDGAGGSAAVLVDLWSWQTGQAICDNCTTTSLITGPTGSGAGVLVMQAALGGMTRNGNSVGPLLDGISYQIAIPVTTTLGMGGNSLTITQSGAGTFFLYADETPGFVYSTGCGFGSVEPLTCGPNLDQSLILSGAASLALGSFSVIDTTTLIGSPPQTNLAPNTIGLVNTDKLGGSSTINIDATPGTQDTNYFHSPITSFTIDLMLTAASFDAPMTVEASAQVQNVDPSFGDGTITPELNDLTCDRPLGVTVPCDQQYQVSANTEFGHNAPEPGSLALLGLSLGLAGWVGRRRRSA